MRIDERGEDEDNERATFYKKRTMREGDFISWTDSHRLGHSQILLWRKK